MRSVVLRSSIRCGKCQLPLRWCVCPAHREVACPVAIDVLVHPRERFRPSSTGHLIQRVVPASRIHHWQRGCRPAAAGIVQPERDVWILHPKGEPAPAGTSPGGVQLLLLDGSWREASTMAKQVCGWGRLVSLPMTGESRYWLRTQADAARFSTVEALLFVLQHLGLGAECRQLRLQFELHVYANLRARGHKEDALAFLKTSEIAAEFHELIAALDVPRPRE